MHVYDQCELDIVQITTHGWSIDFTFLLQNVCDSTRNKSSSGRRVQGFTIYFPGSSGSTVVESYLLNRFSTLNHICR